MGRVVSKEDFETIRTALLSVDASKKKDVAKVAKKLGWGLRTVQRVKNVNTYRAYKYLLLGEAFEAQERRRVHSATAGVPPMVGMATIVPPLKSDQQREFKVGETGRGGNIIILMLLLIYGIACGVVGLLYGATL